MSDELYTCYSKMQIAVEARRVSWPGIPEGRPLETLVYLLRGI